MIKRIQINDTKTFEVGDVISTLGIFVLKIKHDIRTYDVSLATYLRVLIASTYREPMDNSFDELK